MVVILPALPSFSFEHLGWSLNILSIADSHSSMRFLNLEVATTRYNSNAEM